VGEEPAVPSEWEAGGTRERPEHFIEEKIIFPYTEFSHDSSVSAVLKKYGEVMNPDYVTSTTHNPLVEFSNAEELQLCCFTLPVKPSALPLSC